jgi:ubiquinone/menaquinone biosynthesis C-methylase UbiE
MTNFSENIHIYNKHDVVNHYDKKEYLDAAETVIIFDNIKKIINKSILEIGCGTGRTAFFLSRLSDHYQGIDYSESMIACCKNKFLDLQEKFHVCDMRNLSKFDSNSFEFILLTGNALDYIDHEDRIHALAEIQKLLCSGGILAFSSHNLQYYKNTPKKKPTLRFSLSPRQMYWNICSYINIKRNYSINQAKQIFHEQYCHINDVSHDFGLMTYYIDTKHQIQQLSQFGLVIDAVHDSNGHAVDVLTENCTSKWIYYVAHKG